MSEAPDLNVIDFDPKLGTQFGSKASKREVALGPSPAASHVDDLLAVVVCVHQSCPERHSLSPDTVDAI